MKNTTRTLSLIASMSAAAVLAACGGGGGGGTQTAGTLKVSMTDAPSCGYDAVNVTVKAVRVHQSATAGEDDAGWTEIALNPARKINLLDLTNGALEELGQTPLAAGHYTQLRLVLEDSKNPGASMANSIILTTSPANTTEIALATPSADQSGLKLKHQFDVASGERVDLVLDFDACKSIVKRGNSGAYGLKPVINVIPTVLNGIEGFIDPALLGSHVQVSAQQDGTVVRSTTPNSETGKFFLARLPADNYDVVITADNSTAAVIGAVPVASATSVVTVNTNTAPIDLPASASGAISGTALLSPTSATEVAYVAAQQSFANGPTVTIKYQGADVETGAYTLSNLPTAAPWFAQYSATQPLAFTAQANTVPGTGMYKVAASATGYTTVFTPSVDIGTANQLGVDFTLIPLIP